MTLRSLTRILVLWWFAKRPATKGCSSDPWPAGQFTEPGPKETTNLTWTMARLVRSVPKGRASIMLMPHRGLEILATLDDRP
ncbi:hypothetical protein CMEL01_09236 [Colletotrichum melonis]|uniref:Uncharacterized protein n=1 Tax=Colletotrichum melonis TaxID=1209925 RepID=A0AAI9TYV8_9PEZI|nr:hypothetical protein CMEL01_09236 [Colletotrichum melonis]